MQGACALNDTVRDYDARLTRSVLSSLRNIKLETDVTCGADMWSHFGKVIIRDPDEGNYYKLRFKIKYKYRKRYVK